jgi:putative SOS response-associated peptidase YedK
MCGRFTLRTPVADLVEVFELLRKPELKPRYNIAPKQPVAVVHQSGKDREFSSMRWGLVPSWWKDPMAAATLINARAETLAAKRAFRDAFQRRRCLIPADGFYEWRKSEGTNKQPYYVRLKNDRPFAFAGLWEHWEGSGSSAIESCVIVTTEANVLLRLLHDRMPAILPSEDFGRWLDPDSEDTSDLVGLLRPYPPAEMSVYPVSTLVNSPRNDSPECIAKVSA